MTDAPPRLRSVTLLAQDAHRYGAGLIGPSVRASLPIPLAGSGPNARFAFLLARVEVLKAGEPPSLFPPSFVATLAARNGLVLRLRRVTPMELGHDVAQDRPAGFERPPEERLTEEHLTRRARVYQALDRLCPAFFGLTTLPEEERRTFATSYVEAFEGAAEPALLPFRATLGREFDSWVGRP